MSRCQHRYKYLYSFIPSEEYKTIRNFYREIIKKAIDDVYSNPKIREYKNSRRAALEWLLSNNLSLITYCSLADLSIQNVRNKVKKAMRGNVNSYFNNLEVTRFSEVLQK